MKTFFYCSLIAILLSPLYSFGQHQQPKPPADLIKQTIKPKQGKPLAPAAFINPVTEEKKVNWDIKLNQRGGVDHIIDQEDKMQVLKAEKTAAKIEEAKKAGKISPGTAEKLLTGIQPVVISSFEANIQDGWSPPDNNMAISDSGYIVSVINSAISYLDTDGNVILADRSFTNFLSALGVSNFLFDPKVLYDPVEDKFILIVLSGNTPSTSTVVVGFSESQNPSDGWNFYTFDGDYLGDNWFDYPNIAVSETDLFISGNLFTESSGFAETVVLQIKKAEGFAGETVTWEYFNNVLNAAGGDAFTVVPAGYGYDGSYGPGIFMVSNFGFGGNRIFLYEVTDSVNADQSINAYTINCPVYEAPGNALQLGTNDVLSTGGCRIRNAYYANGSVHFGFSFDYIGGYSGVRYNKVDVENVTMETADFGITQTDVAYPTLIPFGTSDSSESVIIGYLQSGSSMFPQIGAVNIDEDLIFGDFRTVKQGESFIGSANSSTSRRWGDYSGGGRWHGADYPSAWFVGCLGINEDYGNWIFEVSDQSNGLGPIADFEASPNGGGEGFTAFFNDLTANGAATFMWTFESGNPATSTEANPVVTYSTQGKYDVTLVVTNSFGSDSITKVDYINVSVPPTAGFTADVTEGLAPLTVNFENQSVNADTYKWTCPGGVPSVSTMENPLVRFFNPGVFTITLTATSAAGVDEIVRQDYIVALDETSSVIDADREISSFKVSPNPMQESFSLEFFIPKKTVMDISVVDLTGRNVKTLLHGQVRAGENVFSFNKNALTPGSYFIVVKDNQQNVIKNEKIIVTR